MSRRRLLLLPLSATAGVRLATLLQPGKFALWSSRTLLSVVLGVLHARFLVVPTTSAFGPSISPAHMLEHYLSRIHSARALVPDRAARTGGRTHFRVLVALFDAADVAVTATIMVGEVWVPGQRAAFASRSSTCELTCPLSIGVQVVVSSSHSGSIRQDFSGTSWSTERPALLECWSSIVGDRCCSKCIPDGDGRCFRCSVVDGRAHSKTGPCRCSCERGLVGTRVFVLEVERIKIGFDCRTSSTCTLDLHGVAHGHFRRLQDVDLWPDVETGF